MVFEHGIAWIHPFDKFKCPRCGCEFDQTKCTNANTLLTDTYYPHPGLEAFKTRIVYFYTTCPECLEQVSYRTITWNNQTDTITKKENHNGANS